MLNELFMKPKFLVLFVAAFLLVGSLNSLKAQTMLTSLNISASPNPFSTSTNVSFNLYQPTPVRFSVLNMNGDEVFVQEKRNLLAGPYSFEWKG
jgi:hypothetical protein